MEKGMNEEEEDKTQKCFLVGSDRDIPIPKRGALLGK
jgi:hypothetical protein